MVIRSGITVLAFLIITPLIPMLSTGSRTNNDPHLEPTLSLSLQFSVMEMQVAD